MKRRLAGLSMALGALCAMPVAGAELTVQGKPEGKLSVWTMQAPVPEGWTGDCCRYARALGVDGVIYSGDWTGDPQRVIVFDVWPAKLPSINAEIDADTRDYLAHDPHGATAPWPLPAMAIPCKAVLHRGSDRVDDVVVFCDPGQKTGVRYSWSMALDASDPAREALLSAFSRVLAGARFKSMDAPTPAPRVSTGHGN